MRLLSDGEREILRDCEFDVDGLYDGERERHDYDDYLAEIAELDDARDYRERAEELTDVLLERYAEWAEPPLSCPLLAALSPQQIAAEREWATNDLVRLWERDAVSFEFLCESQRRLGIGDCE